MKHSRIEVRTSIISGCVVALLLVPFVAAALPSREAGNESAPRTVTVIGEGVVEVEPDQAVVRIGVESIDTDIDEALADNRRIIGEMIDVLVELGVAREDLQTANYSFNFDRSTEQSLSLRSNSNTRYYRVNNMLTVTIRDLAATADIIDAAVVAGANQMWGVEFAISDPGEVERIALERASLDARNRADHLARLSGLRLGEILSVSEVVGSPGSGGIALRAEGLGGGASNVTPGLIRYTARLHVEYDLVGDRAAVVEP